MKPKCFYLFLTLKIEKKPAFFQSLYFRGLKNVKQPEEMKQKSFKQFARMPSLVFDPILPGPKKFGLHLIHLWLKMLYPVFEISGPAQRIFWPESARSGAIFGQSHPARENFEIESARLGPTRRNYGTRSARPGAKLPRFETLVVSKRLGSI